jgi:hypothetical protein
VTTSGRGRPAGVSIGRFLRFDRFALINSDYVAALTAIDLVHGVGWNLPEIPLINAGSAIRRDLGTRDAWLHFESGARGEIVPQSIAVRIGVPHRRLKVMHEIGHYLDGSALPGRGFSSIDAADLEDWRLAVVNSRLFAELTEVEARSADRFRERVSNALLFDELWARAYAQFVAERSGDSMLFREVDETRIARVGDFQYPLHWTQHDFHPIAFAIDLLFRSLGWIARP